MVGRPRTGQTRVMGFRPPRQLREDFEALAGREGRSASDALIEAMHDWIRKKHRESPEAAQE